MRNAAEFYLLVFGEHYWVSDHIELDAIVAVMFTLRQSTSLSSIAPVLPNLVVFRSLTKLFAMAGLRIAYAIAESSSAIEAREIIPSWPVTSFAVEAALGALEDKEYCNTSRLENEREREFLKNELGKLKLQIFDGKANYLLLRLPPSCDSTELWEQLIIGHGIVTRCCDNFEGLGDPCLRIAVKSRKDNAQLVSALTSCLRTKNCNKKLLGNGGE